ncbi:MAG: endonuclease/exonuclease/phosphatase family protein [Verrucomicrobia bacterium]|nr:endonuclease/exonuclease/phosphatase family protein [Verrucomicrobiota bacterium]
MLLSTLGGGVSVLGIGGGVWWGFDLCNHFQMQYLVFQALCVVAVLGLRRFRWALVPALWLCVPVLKLAPYYTAATAESPWPRHLKVLSFNVLHKNKRYADTVSWVQATDPDIAFFPEATKAWEAGLAPLKATMPHSIVHARWDNFGLAVFSKHPIVEQSLVPSTAVGVVMLQVTLEIDGRRVVFVGVHPASPLSAAYSRDRDEVLQDLAKRLNHETRPMIVAGDFNATPWSHAMQPLFDADLRDTMLGRGFSATWRRGLPLVAIPIDHILVGGRISTAKRWTGPDLGSDHRPIVAELLW